MADGRWPMALWHRTLGHRPSADAATCDGRWLMVYDQRLMAYGSWPMAHGRWSMGLMFGHPCSAVLFTPAMMAVSSTQANTDTVNPRPQGPHPRIPARLCARACMSAVCYARCACVHACMCTWLPPRAKAREGGHPTGLRSSRQSCELLRSIYFP